MFPKRTTLGGPIEDELVIGDAAVNDSLPAGVHNDEGQVDERGGRRRPAGLLLGLAVPLHQVLEGNLLKKINRAPGQMSIPVLQSLSFLQTVGTWVMRDQL